MTKQKLKTWKDNFVKEDNAPADVQKRPGICDNCGKGAFTLALGKNALKGQLLRLCKTCGEIINTENEQIIRRGKEWQEGLNL